MSVTAHQGPLFIPRSNPLGSVGGLSANQNPSEGPSLFHQALGMMDPRVPFTYQNAGGSYAPGGTPAGSSATYGWLSVDVQTVNAVPSAISAVNIAASQSPGAGAITLVSTTGAGVTVGGFSLTNAVTGLAVTTTALLALDGAMAGLAFGQDGTVNIWDPTKALCRNVRIVSGGNDSGITFTITGYDLYGYPMSEAITGANAGTASGVKAWKYISGVTHTGSVATTVTIGTGDVYGFPLRSDIWGDQEIVWNNAWITANTGYTAAVTTSPATTTTGDVRGTYAVQSASDGTKRLVISQMPLVANISSTTGLLGVAQNLSSTNGA